MDNATATPVTNAVRRLLASATKESPISTADFRAEFTANNGPRPYSAETEKKGYTKKSEVVLEGFAKSDKDWCAAFEAAFRAARKDGLIEEPKPRAASATAGTSGPKVDVQYAGQPFTRGMANQFVKLVGAEANLTLLFEAIKAHGFGYTYDMANGTIAFTAPVAASADPEEAKKEKALTAIKTKALASGLTRAQLLAALGEEESTVVIPATPVVKEETKVEPPKETKATRRIKVTETPTK